MTEAGEKWAWEQQRTKMKHYHEAPYYAEFWLRAFVAEVNRRALADKKTDKAVTFCELNGGACMIRHGEAFDTLTREMLGDDR